MVILMKVKFVWNTKNSMPDFVSIRVKSGNLGIEPSADQVQFVKKSVGSWYRENSSKKECCGKPIAFLIQVHREGRKGA